MKQVTTWLEDGLFKRYQKHVERLNTTRYLRTQYLIRVDVGDIKQHVVRSSIIYGFTLYSLVVAVIVLLV